MSWPKLISFIAYDWFDFVLFNRFIVYIWIFFYCFVKTFKLFVFFGSYIVFHKYLLIFGVNFSLNLLWSHEFLFSILLIRLIEFITNIENWSPINRTFLYLSSRLWTLSQWCLFYFQFPFVFYGHWFMNNLSTPLKHSLDRFIPSESNIDVSLLFSWQVSDRRLLVSILGSKQTNAFILLPFLFKKIDQFKCFSSCLWTLIRL